MAVRGQKTFEKFRCYSCHVDVSTARGPALKNLFRKQVLLADGRTALADEGYIRESIFEPNAKLVQGYGPIMPTYKGQITQPEIMEILEYIKSLK